MYSSCGFLLGPETTRTPATSTDLAAGCSSTTRYARRGRGLGSLAPARPRKPPWHRDPASDTGTDFPRLRRRARTTSRAERPGGHPFAIAPQARILMEVEKLRRKAGTGQRRRLVARPSPPRRCVFSGAIAVNFGFCDAHPLLGGRRGRRHDFLWSGQQAHRRFFEERCLNALRWPPDRVPQRRPSERSSDRREIRPRVSSREATRDGPFGSVSQRRGNPVTEAARSDKEPPASTGVAWVSRRLGKIRESQPAALGHGQFSAHKSDGLTARWQRFGGLIEGLPYRRRSRLGN